MVSWLQEVTWNRTSTRAAPGGGAVPGDGSRNGSRRRSSRADEATLRQLVTAQAEAWNRHDATDWSKDFAPEADFVNIVGDRLQGKAEIEKRHAGIFASIFKDSRTKVTVRRLVFVSPDVAIVDTDHEVMGHSGLPPGVQNTDESGALRTRMKYVLRKSDGGVANRRGTEHGREARRPRPREVSPPGHARASAVRHARQRTCVRWLSEGTSGRCQPPGVPTHGV